MTSISYFLILTILYKFNITHKQDICLIIFSLYQNVINLKYLNEKSISKNRISYTLFFLNFILLGIFALIILNIYWIK